MRKLRCISSDNGGSGLRIQPVGSTDCERMTIPNNIVQIEERDFRVKEVAAPESLIRVVNATDLSFCGIYASGLTGKAYNNKSLVINSQNDKTGDDNYYKQLLFGIACDALRACKSDLEHENGKAKRLIVKPEDYAFANHCKNVTLQYGMVTCIPVKEFHGNNDCAARLKDRIAGSYTVEFPLLQGSPKISFTLDKKNIGVVPEGGVAIAALKNQLTPETVSLIVDMGHLTTDISVFMGPSPLGKVNSPHYAGATLIGNVKGALQDEGFFLSDEQAATVIATNKVNRGASKVDVSDIVTREKEMFVTNYLAQEIIQVLDRNRINAKQIQNFIPIGAPMNSVDKERSIENAIIKSCGLQYAEVIYMADDLRYVNVTQAAKFAHAVLKGMKTSYIGCPVV